MCPQMKKSKSKITYPTIVLSFCSSLCPSSIVLDSIYKFSRPFPPFQLNFSFFFICFNTDDGAVWRGELGRLSFPFFYVLLQLPIYQPLPSSSILFDSSSYMSFFMRLSSTLKLFKKDGISFHNEIYYFAFLFFCFVLLLSRIYEAVMAFSYQKRIFLSFFLTIFL